jgi:hypothetical protein
LKLKKLLKKGQKQATHQKTTIYTLIKNDPHRTYFQPKIAKKKARKKKAPIT